MRLRLQVDAKGDRYAGKWHEGLMTGQISNARSARALLLTLDETTQGSTWGYLKSQFSRDLVKFWRYMPTKWLQNRTNGSKTAPGIPPHRAFCGLA